MAVHDQRDEVIVCESSSFIAKGLATSVHSAVGTLIVIAPLLLPC